MGLKAVGHSEECRARMEKCLQEDSNPRWERATHRIAKEMEKRIKEEEKAGADMSVEEKETVEKVVQASKDMDVDILDCSNESWEDLGEMLQMRPGT